MRGLGQDIRGGHLRIRPLAARHHQQDRGLHTRDHRQACVQTVNILYFFKYFWRIVVCALLLFVSIYCWTSLEKSPVQLAKSFIVSSTQFILNILSAVGDTLSVSFNRMNIWRGDGEKVFYCIEILTLKDMDETRRKSTYSASQSPKHPLLTEYLDTQTRDIFNKQKPPAISSLY